MDNKNKVIYRSDYKAPEYLISEVDLFFDIFDEEIIVKSKLKVSRNVNISANTPIVLNGENLKLNTVCIDDKILSNDDYVVDSKSLTISQVPNSFELSIETIIYPASNKACSGIYKSGNIICSQNEPEGFRRITYFIDRPDVMAVYKVAICADLKKYPVLLSNGNKLSESFCSTTNRKTVSWEDPFPKPAYLFALVAGDLGKVADKFITKSGRKITLEIFVDKGNEKKANFAIESLKKAMKWDEDKFNLEYDLNLYMIVAVDSFNFGAMENKGLNIFNSQYVLADSESATDSNFQGIESVIGHEYFHNWTGNRITCRDWFQLTLKEGLTVFRDQEFSSDMNSRDDVRLAEVKILRDMQFAEDASPMSHPIRPDSYIEIDNFYTSTVYNKGAEVIRMIQTIIGKDKFKEGIDKYFELFDGQAVTCDDFISAMEIVSKKDFSQFKNWYSQNGTPLCEVKDEYNEISKEYKLKIKQKLQNGQNAFNYPLDIGLVAENGEELLSKQLIISQKEEFFTFKDIKSKPIPSLLRNFSAPIKIEYDYQTNDLLKLLKFDKDTFNKYEVGQILIKKSIKDIMDKVRAEKLVCIEPELLNALGAVLDDNSIDNSIKASIITFPTLSNISNDLNEYDFDAIFNASEFLIKSFALRFEQKFLSQYTSLKSATYAYSQKECGKRKLKNIILFYLGSLGNSYDSLIFDQFKNSDNMTDAIAALSLLVRNNSNLKQAGLNIFYKKWKNDSLTMNKWFGIQAGAKYGDVLGNIKRIIENDAYDKENPNKIRSIYNIFASNQIYFHKLDGSGYSFIADKIMEVDKINPNLSSSLAKGFKDYKKVNPKRQKLIKNQLENILKLDNISKGLYEIVSKILN